MVGIENESRDRELMEHIKKALGLPDIALVTDLQFEGDRLVCVKCAYPGGTTTTKM